MTDPLDLSDPPDPSDPSAPAAAISTSYLRRLAITVVLLGVYVLGRRVPLPGVDRAVLREMRLDGEGSSLMALGITPLIFGFLLVEVFSLTASPGRRLRKLGTVGRAQLNRAALGTSLVLAGLQGIGIALFLENAASPSGSPVVNFPGYGYRILVGLTLSAATAAFFTLGQAVSTRGIGNGFALMILTRAAATDGPRVVAALRPPGAVRDQGLVLLLILGLVVFLVRFFRTADDRWLPAFPQGTVPLLVALLLGPLIGRAVAESVSRDDLLEPAYFVLLLLTIALVSWGTFHLFSSRPRLLANRTDPESSLGDLATALKRRAVGGTIFFLVGTAAVGVLRLYQPSPLAKLADTLGVGLVIGFVAIGLDVWDQFRFERRVGETALLVQLDNVHFSYQLEERLQEEGLDALARGHQYRSLRFFFGALFKIDVLVAAGQLERARAVLAELELAREIQAF